MTITSSSIVALFSLGVVVALVFGGVTLWRRRVPGLALGPTLRSAIYLTRYAVALEYYGLRRREITSHVEALRGDLTAVDSDEVDATLGRLGPPRTLAAEVTIDELRPSLLRGSIWFGVTLFITLAASILATEAFLGGFEAVAQQGDRASWSGLGFGAEATMGPDGRASSIGFGWPILLPVLAFAVGARLWRLWGRVRTASHPSPAR